MTLEPELLAILACPEDKGPLYYLEPRTGCTTRGCSGVTRCVTASR